MIETYLPKRFQVEGCSSSLTRSRAQSQVRWRRSRLRKLKVCFRFLSLFRVIMPLIRSQTTACLLPCSSGHHDHHEDMDPPSGCHQDDGHHRHHQHHHRINHCSSCHLYSSIERDGSGHFPDRCPSASQPVIVGQPRPQRRPSPPSSSSSPSRHVHWNPFLVNLFRTTQHFSRFK